MRAGFVAGRGGSWAGQGGWMGDRLEAGPGRQAKLVQPLSQDSGR